MCFRRSLRFHGIRRLRLRAEHENAHWVEWFCSGFSLGIQRRVASPGSWWGDPRILGAVGGAVFSGDRRPKWC